VRPLAKAKVAKRSWSTWTSRPPGRRLRMRGAADADRDAPSQDDVPELQQTLR